MDDFEKDSKFIEEEVETQKEFPEEPEEKKFDFMKMLDSPIAKILLDSGKEMFKKENPNPDTCEITIKAPSEVILKLFKVE